MTTNGRTRGAQIWRRFLASMLLGALGTPAMAQAVPNLSGLWDNKDEYFKAPKSGPGPAMRRPEVTHDRYQADYSNPVLMPWVREVLKKNQEAEVDGLHPSPAGHSNCWPSSGPGVMALRGVMHVLQTRAMVILMFHNDQQVRYIYLNQPHSKAVPLTWFGESVGRYEGDSLVVDTIGLAAKKYSVLDVFGTPHTDALHVVEQFHLSDGGKALEDHLYFEDPGAFTTPFNAIQTYTRSRESFQENVCAENNRSVGVTDMPFSLKPDF